MNVEMRDRSVSSLLVMALSTFLLQIPSSQIAVSASEPNPGIVAAFQNFYAPVDVSDCPNGIAIVSRPDNKSFIEFDNFSLTVNNSKKLVLGSSIYSTFATEDGKKEIELPVKICGNDQNYLGQRETYTLQIKFVSSDRKYAQELAIDFTLIPVDDKAKASKTVRDNCSSTGTGYAPYFVNWNIENSPKAREGKTFTIAGTLYRFGYPADLERVKVTRSTLNPSSERIVAQGITDSKGKFKLSWKIDDKNYPLFMLEVEERIRPVGPFYGTFDSMRMPIEIDCDGTCKYKRMNQLFAVWEGVPAKSSGECAIAKYEYSLVAPLLPISISGSRDEDRNLWLKALIAVKNSLSNPSTLSSKETSAYLADPGASSSYSSFGGSGGGTVWVSGHMRNGKYVRGYSRRKG